MLTQKSIDDTAAKVAKCLNIDIPPIEIIEAQNSEADLGTGIIRLANWCLETQSKLTYNLCHEMLHLALKLKEHSTNFKIAEAILLKEFGLTPIYEGDYPDVIINERGCPVWER